VTKELTLYTPMHLEDMNNVIGTLKTHHLAVLLFNLPNECYD